MITEYSLGTMLTPTYYIQYNSSQQRSDLRASRRSCFSWMFPIVANQFCKARHSLPYGTISSQQQNRKILYEFNEMPSSTGKGNNPLSGRTVNSGARTLFADPPKTVYLIRHGESIAQTVRTEKRARDPTLRDCGLNERGEEQAAVLPGILGLERYRHIDCVISSPLTRAVRTSVLAFPSKPIIINYDLMEIGRDKDPMPENQPRPILKVMTDTGGESRIDEAYFAPTNKPFPESHMNSPGSIRKSKLPKAWSSIWEYCNRRNSQHVAVVCHFNVIRSSLSCHNVKPQNAIPIECRLFRDGTLELVDVIFNEVSEMSETLAELKRKNKWCMRSIENTDGDEQNEAPVD